jgi:hypothetical protein
MTINTFEELSNIIPRGLDSFLNLIVSGKFNKLFKSSEHFISIGSILILISTFLLVSININ